MKKKILTLFVIMAMVMSLTACSSTLGKWRITEVTAGDVNMTQEDIQDMGLDAGYIKINKSGSCVLNFLGDEYEGTWTQAEDGSMTFAYGDDLSGTGTITDEVLTFEDAQGSVYTLKK